MESTRTPIKNLALVLCSIGFVVLLSLGLDRAFGVLMPPMQLPGTMELIFPPNAEQHYESIEFKYTANINKLGLREREIGPKQPGVFRICALGDSYTYGWGVEAEETWLRKLEAKLNAEGLKVETINLGKPGSGPPFYAELAEKALPYLEPDLVLVAVLMGNDIMAGNEDRSASSSASLPVKVTRTLYPNLLRYLQRPGTPVESRTTEVPPQVASAESNIEWTRNTAQEFLKKMGPEEQARYALIDPQVRAGFETGRFNPYMVDLALKAPEVYNATLNLDDAWFQSTISKVADCLRVIAHAAESVGAETVVASLPDGPYVNDHAWQNIQKVGYTVPEGMVDSDGPDEAVHRAASEAGLPFVSVAGEFKKHRGEPDLYFPFDGHMTAKGHTLFAESIAPQVAAIVREAAK